MNLNHNEIPLHTHCEWKRQIITSVGEDGEKLDTSYITGGNKNGAAAMENSLVVPQKVKQRVTIRHSNSTQEN